MDDEQLLDYEEENEEAQEQNKNETATNGEAKKIKVLFFIFCCFDEKTFI